MQEGLTKSIVVFVTLDFYLIVLEYFSKAHNVLCLKRKYGLKITLYC